MVRLTEDMMFCGIITFSWLEYLWSMYLAWRQYNVTRRTVKTPEALQNVMDKETFDKARLYSMAKNEFLFVKDTFAIVVSTLTLYYGLLPGIWEFAEGIKQYEGEVMVSCIWLFVLTTIQTIVDLPLTIYHTFVLEEKFGFNKQTARFFIVDQIKAYILSQVLMQPLCAMVIMIVKYSGDYFFLWLWMAVGVVSLILITIYPSFIAPLFDKYTLLPEGELRTQIEKLATELKFPLTELYVVEGSKRSSHSNAYFYGLFNSKRIVLFNTLLENPEMDNEAIVAVLSHELGHWQFGHITKNLIIMQVNLFLMFALFGLTFKSPLIYKVVGFRNNVRPVLVGLIVILHYVTMPYNALLSFLVTCLSRRFEFQADAFAAKLGKAQELKRALVQLFKDNLEFPVYDRIYSAWHHSHPQLLERLGALDEKKTQ